MTDIESNKSIENIKNIILSFGKYKGKTYQDIIDNNDLKYIKWCLKNKVNLNDFKILYDYLIEKKKKELIKDKDNDKENNNKNLLYESFIIIDEMKHKVEQLKFFVEYFKNKSIKYKTKYRQLKKD